MASSLMSRECDTACKEEAEFLLKFIITSLTLSDKEAYEEFKDILVAITFDGNVIKIENFENGVDGEMKKVGRQLTLQTTSELLSEKFRTCPIMFDLSRGCAELGTLKVDITNCFADAVKCEEFSSEATVNEFKFVKDGNENGTMNMIFEVSRPAEDENSQAMKKLYQGYTRKKSEVKRKLVKVPSIVDFNVESLSSSSPSGSNITCETDLCPLEEDSDDRCGQPKSHSLTSSTKSKSGHSKCCSDVAVHDFPYNQKTFYNGCGGFSTSGVTCENKVSRCRKSADNCAKYPCKSTPVAMNSTYKKPRSRICNECFEDLSNVPKCVPCPNCVYRNKLNRRLVLFKNEAILGDETQKVRGVVKSIFEEIFLETKDRLVNDWKRLKCDNKKVCKKARKVKKCTKNVSRKINKKSMSRCSKLLNAREKSRNKKYSGLRMRHPGVIVGHDHCHGDGLLVPKNMGWLWNVGIAGLPVMRRGWRPGAVKLTVAKIMKYFVSHKPEQPKLVKKTEPPTLRVKKKNGEYLLIMNPLRDETKPLDHPSPIVFKITKTEDVKKRSEARAILKVRGVKKCCDCSSIKKCFCLNECDKAKLKYELEQVSNCLCIDPEMDYDDMKDSSDSEIDMEFTPPSAAKNKNPCFKCKPVQVSFAGTQYENPIEEVFGETCVKKCVDLKPKTEATESVYNKPKKVVARMMRDKPLKKCRIYCVPKCLEFTCPPFDHRLTTNYNPIIAQCPPQPTVCADQYKPYHETTTLHHHHQYPAFCN